MKISKVNRIFNCNHCGGGYSPKRSDQKFCSDSCRSSNHQMNKPKPVQALEVVKEKQQVNPKSAGKDILTSGVGAGLAVLGQNLAEKIGGVHNSDLLKEIDELKKTIQANNPRDEAMLKLINAIYVKLDNHISLENSLMNNLG